MTDQHTTADPSSTKKSRRLYLWLFVLSSVLVLVAIAPFWVRYHRQNAVIERLFELGATIQVEPMSPQWLPKAAYRHHMLGFYTVTLVLMENSRFTDDSLNDIRVFSELKELLIPHSQVTDSGLVHLKGMVKLEEMWLDHTQITDNGLLHLKHLDKLSHLSLKGTKVTDAGVKDLQAALPNCEIEWSKP